MSMAQLRRLPIADAGAGSDHAVLALAAKHALTTYEASHLALALAQGTPFASTDQRLAAAALEESIKVLGPCADQKIGLRSLNPLGIKSDGNAGFSVHGAIQFAKGIKDLNNYYYEEPTWG